MDSLEVYPLFNMRALVTRESARSLENSLRPLLGGAESELVLDFRGVDAVTPSFVDELLLVIQQLMTAASTPAELRITFLNPPTRLSAKFASIARAHEVEVTESADGSWSISNASKGKLARSL
jgi:hypothetical protein